MSLLINGSILNNNLPFYYGNSYIQTPYLGYPVTSIGNPYLGPYLGNPYLGNPYLGNPYLSNPYLGNPYLGNPYLSNPLNRLNDRYYGGYCGNYEYYRYM